MVPGKWFRNLASLSAAEVSGQIAFAIVGILVARKLGPSDFGAYVTAMGLLRVGGLLSNMGMGEVLLPRITRSPDERRQHAITGLLCCGGAFPISAFIVLVVALAAGFDNQVLRLFLLGMPMLLLESISTVGAALCQLNRRFLLMSLVSASRMFVCCVLMVACLLFDLPITCLVISHLVGWLVAVSLYAPVLLPVLRGRIRAHDLKGFASEALPFGLSNWLSYIYVQSDVLIISAVMGKESAGLYAVGMRLPFLLLVFSSALYKILIPRMFELSTQDRPLLKRLLEISWGGLIAACLGVCIGGSILAKPLIEFLFGAAYATSALILQVGIWLVIVFALATAVGQTLTALFLQKRKVVFQAATCLLKVALVVLLLPHWKELAGAAATVASATALAVLYAFAVRREIGAFRITETVWRAVLAATIMGVVVWYSNRAGIHVLISILLGAGCYGFVIWALGGYAWFRTVSAAFTEPLYIQGENA